MGGERMKVLFLCTGNSARSQMAEAILRRLGGERFDVYSAGLSPHQSIHRMTYQVMNEVGYDLSGQRPKSLKEYFAKMTPAYVIFVCDQREASCPFLWPTGRVGVTWPFPDPATLEGDEIESLNRFRDVRDQIEVRIRDWLRGFET